MRGMNYFLRGLGAGIVFTALILCSYYRKNDIEQADVVQQAKELGMVFPEGTKEPELQSDIQKESESTPESVKQESKETKSTESASGKPESTERISEEPVSTPKATENTVKQESTKKPVTTKKPEASESPSSAKGTRFTVRDGLLSSSVAREMKEAGIVKSDKALDAYLEKNGYATAIREGTYWIPAGATYEQIAKIITRQS